MITIFSAKQKTSPCGEGEPCLTRLTIVSTRGGGGCKGDDSCRFVVDRDDDYRRRCTCRRNANGFAAAVAGARWPDNSARAIKTKRARLKDAPWKAGGRRPQTVRTQGHGARHLTGPAQLMTWPEGKVFRVDPGHPLNTTNLTTEHRSLSASTWESLDRRR